MPSSAIIPHEGLPKLSCVRKSVAKVAPPHEARAEELLQRQIHAVLGGGEVVARVVEQREARADVERGAPLPAEQFGAVEARAVYVVNRHGGAKEQVVGGAEEPARLYLRLPALHVALVGVHVSHCVAHSPEVAGKGVEIGGVVDALAGGGEYVGAAHAEHVEPHGRHVAEERHVARRLECVVGVGAVESGGYEPDAELRVGAVVRSADDAEVEAPVLLLLVGVVEIVEEARHETALTWRDTVGWLVCHHGTGRHN